MLLMKLFLILVINGFKKGFKYIGFLFGSKCDGINFIIYIFLVLYFFIFDIVVIVILIVL